MIAALEGAPGVGKSTLARALEARGAVVVPEVNRLFLRPYAEPADWYLDRQNARWEIAARAAADGRKVLLDGDPLQPLWFGWLYPDQGWTGVEEAASFFAERLASGRMRLPDRYLILLADEGERAQRLHGREMVRHGDANRAAAKVARYAGFGPRQRPLFDALASRYPGWVILLDTTAPDLPGRTWALLADAPAPPDGATALAFAAAWLRANPASR